MISPAELYPPNLSRNLSVCPKGMNYCHRFYRMVIHLAQLLSARLL